MVVPSELLDQFCKRRAVLFVGAGVSRTAGLPNWLELVDPLKRELGDCPEDATPIDIAQYFLSGKKTRRLAEIVKSRLAPPNVAPSEAHNLIATLPLYRIFTTNLDNLLEKACERANVAHQVIYNTGTLEGAEEGKLAIIKLHGDLSDPASIVLATEDYDEYLERNPDISEELRYALRRQTVLFLGYGFNDPNINAIFRTVRRSAGRLARNHFILLTSPHHLVRAELERRGLQVISLPGKTDQTMELIQWLRELALQVRSREPFRARTNLGASAAQFPLIGRDEERRAVLEALSKRRVVVIRGPAGVGKTSLAMDIAAEWARQGGPKDLEHLVWLSATDHSGKPYELNDLLNSIGNAVGHPVVEQTTAVDKKKSYVQGILARPTLLIIDNFDLRSGEEIFHWLNNESSPAFILICSQRSTKGKLKEGQEIGLEGLKPAEAIELVKRLAGDFLPMLHALDNELPHFVVSCVRNPRALELAVGLMQNGQFTLEEIANLVHSCSNNVDEIIDKLLDYALQTLTPPARQVLRCATMFRVNDLQEEALLRGTGLAETDFRRGIDDLVRFRLLEPIGNRRYAVHQKLRALVQDKDREVWSKDVWSKQDVFRRCAEYYRDRVRASVTRPGLPRYWNALVSHNMQSVDADWPMIRELMDWANLENDKILIDFVFLLVHYMDSRFLNELRVTYVKAAVRILAALGGREGDLALLKIDALGWTFVERNSRSGNTQQATDLEDAEDPEKVILEGLALAKELHRENIEKTDLMALAEAWLARLEMQRRKNNEAKNHMNEALKAPERCSPWIQMRIQMVAGDLALNEGRTAEALQCYEKAKSITKEYGGEGDGYQIQPRIGMALVSGNEPDALARAKTIFEQLRDTSTVPMAKLYGAYGMALVVKHEGDEDEARVLVERADRELHKKTEPNHLIDWLKSSVFKVPEGRTANIIANSALQG